MQRNDQFDKLTKKLEEFPMCPFRGMFAEVGKLFFLSATFLMGYMGARWKYKKKPMDKEEE